jgi:hypothetical protein
LGFSFRDLLLAIDETFRDQAFTTDALALRLNRPKKQLSNSLARLERMGFLKRERVKRPCVTLKGTFCYKGFQYRYKLSKQGQSYIRWLNEQKPIEDLAYVTLMSKVYSCLPEDLRKSIALIAARRSTYRYKGPQRQFRFLDNDAFPLIYLTMEHAKLARENWVLKRCVRDLSFLLGYFMALASNYREQYHQLSDRMNKLTAEMCRVYAESVGSLLKSYLKVFMSLLGIINTLRSTNELLIFLLANALPRETFVRTMNFVSEFRGEARQKYAIQEPTQVNSGAG